jgi:hypothetical protein
MSDVPRNARSITGLLRCLVGPAVWAGHFLVMYGAHALICARVAPDESGRVWLFSAATASTLALLVLAGLVWRLVRARRRGGLAQPTFPSDVSIALAVLSLIGVIWVALPAALMPPCAAFGAPQ